MRVALIIAVVLLADCAVEPVDSTACHAGLANDDQAAIRRVMETYRTSWLRGDKDGVLSTFSADAVLLPAHGAPSITGTAAITSYWWPAAASSTTVTKLDISLEGLAGDCRAAWVHGHDDVGWSTVENGVTKSFEHPGTYLNVLTKRADGSWKISRHMWDDGSR